MGSRQAGSQVHVGICELYELAIEASKFFDLSDNYPSPSSPSSGRSGIPHGLFH